MKKNYLLIAFLTLLFTLNNPGNAKAATGISDAEQLILDKLVSGAEINGEMSYLPVAYINQAENELIRNDVDLTAKQADMIISKIDEAIEIISEMDNVDMNSIPNSEAALRLLTVATEAASAVDYEVSVDIVNSSIDVRNSEGDTVFIAKNMVNQTGYNDDSWLMNSMLAIMVVIIGTLLLSIYTIKDVGLNYEA
ncbi:MAG: hypothetical protein K0R34_3380 [Herbinix sp.]|nr:hypothetical protein [Herbinix sp.]